MAKFTESPWEIRKQAHWSDSPIIIQPENSSEILAIVYQDVEVAEPNARLMVQSPVAHGLLKRMEWAGWDSNGPGEVVTGVCPRCYKGEEQGHADDCTLDKYFRDVEGA
jgi:hypothetical protein